MTVAACAEIVRAGDPDRFMSAMAAPVAAREKLFPIYALNVEVARAPWVTAEPMIAEMRLQWWRDALEEIAGGGPVRRHEVTTPLAEVLDAEGARLLDRAVEARRKDIEAMPFGDAAALLDYLDATAGTLMWVSARALGAAEEGAVRARGRAMGLAAYLGAVPTLKARAKYPLPDESDAALRALATAELSRLKEARRTAVAAAARPALFPSWAAERVLATVQRAPDRVLSGGLVPSEAARRFALLRLAFGGRI